MSKRKNTSDAESAPAEGPRRSSRLKTSRDQVRDAQAGVNGEPKKQTREASPEKALSRRGEQIAEPSNERPRASKNTKAIAHSPGEDAVQDTRPSGSSSSQGDKQYWLLKAEPESRLERGVDVKFSIDDLAAKKEPEPWDGIRAYPARNNLRAMKEGDLAFLYHSNCKEPGIVGTMEIVREHSPDLSAHDPKAPYYDPTSKPSDPKWSVVHVVFRSKFAVPIGLKELRVLGAPGKPLEAMQMLKQSRLSVSKVSAGEWVFLNDLAKEKGGPNREGAESLSELE